MKKAIPKKCWTQKKPTQPTNHTTAMPQEPKSMPKAAQNSHEQPCQRREHIIDVCQKTPNMLDAQNHTRYIQKKKPNRKTPATGWMLKRKTVLVNTMEMPWQPQKHVRD